MTLELKNFVKVRSFLAGNVEVILENLAARRESSKIDSEDLFADSGASVKTMISWQKNYRILKTFDVLTAEKESLGLYVSGDPLNSYINLLQYVRETAGRDDIYLIILEKVKKIFTRSGTMMFALEISMSELDAEGIIFPKNAMRLSGKLEEKGLYWVKGNITDRSKNKKRNGPSDLEIADGEGGGEDAVQEFAELPKLAVEDLSKFEEGVIPLFANEEIKMSNNRASALQKINWIQLKSNPDADFITETAAKNSLSEGLISDSPQEINVRIMRLPNSLGKNKLLDLKQRLRQSADFGGVPVRLEIQDSKGAWQKAKGQFWIDIDSLSADFRGLLSAG